MPVMRKRKEKAMSESEKLLRLMEMVKLEETRLAERAERVAFMNEQHLIMHEGVTALNRRYLNGEFGERGCLLRGGDIECDACGLAKTVAGETGSTARTVPGQVLRIFQFDVHEAGVETRENRMGYRYTMSFVCRASGYKFLFHSRDKTAASCLEAFKALQVHLRSLSPFVMKKWGYPVGESVTFESDVDAGTTTTWGYTGTVMDDWIADEGFGRLWTGAGSKAGPRNGKVERGHRTMATTATAMCAESGFRMEMFFDACDMYCVSSNHTAGGSNPLGGVRESPAQTCGIPSLSSRLRRFGQLCWVLNDGTTAVSGAEMSAAKCHRKGRRAVLIGIGEEVLGYKAIVLGSKKIVCSRDVHVPKHSWGTVLDFVRSVREDPFVAGLHGRWVYRIFSKGGAAEIKVKLRAEATRGPAGELIDVLGDDGLPAVEPIIETGDGALEFLEKAIELAKSGGAKEAQMVEMVRKAIEKVRRSAPSDKSGKSGGSGGSGSSGGSGGSGSDGDVTSPGGREADESVEVGEIKPHEEAESELGEEREQEDELGGNEERESEIDEGAEQDELGDEEELGEDQDESDEEGVTSNPFDREDQPLFLQFGSRTIGTAPGHDRGALRKRGSPKPAKSGRRRTKKNQKFGSEMSGAQASELAQRARKEMLDVEFDQSHSKSGISGERYERYKRLSKMQEVLDAEKEPLMYSNGTLDTVMRKGKNRFGKSGNDLKFDIEKGLCMIKDGHGGYLKAAVIAQQKPVRKAISALRVEGVLDRDEPWKDEALEWLKNSGIDSERRGGAAELPGWMAMAAKSSMMFELDGMIEPLTVQEAMNLPEWEMWKDAIEKEVLGLVANGTWDEVDRSEAAARGKSILPSRMVLKLKLKQDTEKGSPTYGRHILDKVKARLVAGGHRSVAGRDHFETAAYTSKAQSMRMLFALSASRDWDITSNDVSQAFLFSELEEGRDIFMELPELLTEGGVRDPGVYDSRCGSGKGSGKIGKLARGVYGLPEASRMWSRNLRLFFKGLNSKHGSELDRSVCRALISDRMTFRWSCWINGKKEEAIVCTHVDDLVIASSGPAIKAEFERQLRKFFGEERITGGEEVSYVLGMRVERDREKKTIKLSQGAFVRSVLEKFGIEENLKVVQTPLPTGTELKKYEGTASASSVKRYLSLVGCVQWLAMCTRPDLSHAAGMLGRYSANPGPEHEQAGLHCLRYLAGTPDHGITFHGSDEVLMEGYDHRDKLIAAVDSDLGGCKDSNKSTGGYVVWMNGGPVAYRSRKSGTQSVATLEAEMKAASQVGMEIEFLRDLALEMTGEDQGCVRVFEDNSGCTSVAHGLKDTAKTGHFRRTCSQVEQYCVDGHMWLDWVPGSENPADIFTKAVKPAELFHKLRDVVMGITPVVYLSKAVQEMLRSNGTAGHSDVNRSVRRVMDFLES